MFHHHQTFVADVLQSRAEDSDASSEQDRVVTVGFEMKISAKSGKCRR